MRATPLDVMPVFRSVMQAQLLALLLPNPKKRWAVPELAERVGSPRRTVTTELSRLADVGVLNVETVGKAHLYSAATESPFYQPLLELVERSLGPEVELRRLLGEIHGVEAAAVFGSWARAEQMRPTSDIDVLVIGNFDFNDVADAVREVEKLADREIHLVSYTRDELEERIANDSVFVRDVLGGKLKPLIGAVDSLTVAPS